jgi:soluble lytic murein transglycosylase
MEWCNDGCTNTVKHSGSPIEMIANMTLPFFKSLYKLFTSKSSLRAKRSNPAFIFWAASSLTLLAMTITLHALSPTQELQACKTALLAQFNEGKRMNTYGCPIVEKLIFWGGILKRPEQFTPRELITFVDAHPHWPFYDKLCQRAEEALAREASPAEVLAWFGKHPPQTPAGALVYAATLLSRKDKAKAAEVVTAAWHTMEMNKTEERQFLTHFGPFLSQNDHTTRLQFLLWEGDVEGARGLLVRVPAKARKIGHIRLSLLEGKVPQNLSRLTDEGVLYERVKWHKKRKEWGAAAKILIHTPPSAAYAQKWWTERNYVAREFIALHNYKKAYQILKNHALAPGTETFADAEWLLGWLDLRFLHKAKEAQHHFETFISHVNAAISKARGAYWLGRAYEAQKQRTLAAKAYRKAAHYRTTYYGQLAATKLCETCYPLLSAAPKATAEEVRRFNQRDLVKAAYILKALGQDAAHELSKFLSPIATQSKTKGERELAVQLAARLSPYDVVWVAKRAGLCDPVLLKTAYPVCPLPKGCGLPESALLLSIAYKESQFNPTSISPKGAMGLLQLKSEAAAAAAQRLNVHHTEQKIFDPTHNLLLGSEHLSSLLNDFENSYVLAAAAYNAGPTPVGRWIRSFGDPRNGKVDVIDWIELIPYGETRNYVQRVLENVTNYRSLKGIPQKTLIDDLKRQA